MQQSEIVQFVVPDRGFIDGEKLQSYVNRALKGRSIEQLDLPFVAVATELRTGTLAAFNRGDTGMAVRARAACRWCSSRPPSRGRNTLTAGW